ncbi:MAG TPA: GtrA family protein [Paucimonas sp.]|nr:GtrA family protein [Paucimonas sp.]
MKRLELARLFAFGVVGGFGFAVDGGILTLLSQRFGIDIYVSRGISFSIATVATWLLNRRLVFKMETAGATPKGREYGRYLLVQTGGALLNLGVFSALIRAYPSLHAIPVVPLAVGAVFGLALNYSGARFWVFKPTSTGG